MKKQVMALFTALAMTLSFVPALSEEEKAFSSESVSLAEAQGTAGLFGSPYAKDRYSICLTADNLDGEEYQGSLITAVYDNSGKLVKTDSYQITVPKGKKFTKTVYVDYSQSEQYVKGFFWSDKTSLIPLTESVVSTEISLESVKIPLSESNVWSTDRQDDHPVGSIFDGSKDTYMAGQAQSGVPVTLYAELDRIYELTQLCIGFHSASNQRSYSFDVQGSLDGKAYYSVLETQSSDKSSDFPEVYDLDISAKYLKVNVYGYNGNDSGWVRLNHLSLYGRPDNDSRVYSMDESFTGRTDWPDSSPVEDNWFAYALDEETYTDYTPSTGSRLYSEFYFIPDDAGMGSKNSALVICDEADRSGDRKTGAGSIGAFRKLDIPENIDYDINFKLYIPDNSENIHWSGINLLSSPVTGGADRTPASALQLRFSHGASGSAVINSLSSVQYNEGDLTRLFDNEFRLGYPWEVSLRVHPQRKNVDVTIYDGLVSETKTVGYSYTDVEKVNNQTWKNTCVNYIMFNTGAGGKLRMYVDDFNLSYDQSEDRVSKVIYEQDFENVSTIDAAGIQQAVVKKNDDGTTGGGSIGASLQAAVASSGTFGGKVLKLTDTSGSDGLVAAVPLTIPDNNNKYTIKWKMRDFSPNNYSGISLASGFNLGKTDYDHPMALQMRYSMQNNNSQIQFNNYNSIVFNDGGYNGFMATGSNRLNAGSALEFSITVNPVTKIMDISVTDGSRTVTNTHSFETSSSDGKHTENWNDKRVDTLLFHTAAGGKSDCIIDNIQVIDTGVEEKASSSPVMGIVRLESQWGRGKYVTQRDDTDLGNLQGIDPALTRFVERPSLAGQGGVSLESVDKPGHYIYAKETDGEKHTFKLILKELDGTAQDRAFASFYKSDAANEGSYTGTCVNYSPIWDTSKTICYTNTESDPLSLIVLNDSDYTHSDLFYLRSEAVNYVSDNFKGSSLSSQWHNNYPWKSANMTNDSYNFTALIDHRNIEVSGGRLLLKATKINEGDWSKDSGGQTGIDYNGKYSKDWIKWAGRVGVISSKKVFNRQSLVSGRFKQPESPVGYWNAFWLNAASGWPPETDIFEYMSSKGTNTWFTATHRKNSGGTDVGYGGWQKVDGINVRTGYHDFTLDWGYNYMRFYVDGILYRTVTGDDVDEQNKGVQMILNTGIGGWESEPDNSMVWDTGMECQWIRSFKY